MGLDGLLPVPGPLRYKRGGMRDLRRQFRNLCSAHQNRQVVANGDADHEDRQPEPPRQIPKRVDQVVHLNTSCV
jgi:hypothetical protein